MTEKAIALQLADAIWPWPGISILADGQAKTLSLAAAELRRLHEVEQQRAELLAALKEITPNMPPPDAPCHYGIVPQSSCLRCQRIARSIAAIAKAEGAK